MKIIKCDQGSVDWMLARLSIPTASCYDRVLTPRTLKPAKGQYRAELLASYLLGQPVDWGSNAWTERGTDMEDEARRWYEFNRDVEVEQVGFISRDDGKTGGSPDGLVGDGGLEIKCLRAVNHMVHLMDDPPAYVGQVQGYMYLTGREWWDILFYNPSLPRHVVRVERDPKWLAAFVPVLEDFLGKLDADKERWEFARNIHPIDPEIQALLKESDEAWTNVAPTRLAHEFVKRSPQLRADLEAGNRGRKRGDSPGRPLAI